MIVRSTEHLLTAGKVCPFFGVSITHSIHSVLSSKRPLFQSFGNFMGTKPYFKIEVKGIIVLFLAHNPTRSISFINKHCCFIEFEKMKSHSGLAIDHAFREMGLLLHK